MGWAYCGKDREDRDIGYAIEATCDHPDCNAKIDRGLAYACGGIHGEDTQYCENYFCYEHLIHSEQVKQFICEQCFKLLKEYNDECR